MGFRPWMMRINTVAMAKISRMWMNPPNVYDETIPSTHRIISSTKIVQSIETPPKVFGFFYPDAKTVHESNQIEIP
jgi:hypothetical protein